MMNYINLLIREVENIDILNYCRKNKIDLCAYRPLQLGQLADSGIEILKQMSKKYNKSEAQISLKWLLSKKGVITITKALSPKHIKEDIDIFDWNMKKSDLNKLDKDFPIQLRLSDCTPPVKYFKE